MSLAPLDLHMNLKAEVLLHDAFLAFVMDMQKYAIPKLDNAFVKKALKLEETTAKSEKSCSFSPFSLLF